jgi:hypothetical protein
MRREVRPEEVRGNLFRVNHLMHGWAIPLQVRILLDAVCEVAITNKNTVYSLSGPDMHKYITEPQHAPVIETMFQKMDAAGVFDDLSVDQLTLVIVPVQEARFVSSARERPALDRLVAAYHELIAAAAQCPCAFYDNKTAVTALTQHDLVAGEELYIHPDVTHVSMEVFEAIAALVSIAAK